MPHVEVSTLALLLAQIIAIVAISRGIGLFTRRLSQPLVVAEMVAGIALGPSVLGIVWPDAAAALFPASSLPSLKLVSQLGLIVFMFLVGLELDGRLLRGRALGAGVVGLSGVMVPFAAGAVTALWLYPSFAGPSASRLAFASFVGAAMCVTAFPVLARLLSERNLLASRIGVLAVAVAAVDDVAAWCVLAFVCAAAKSGGVSGAVWTTVLSLGYVAAMLLVVRPFLARLAARVAGREGLTPAVLVVTLLFLAGSAALTDVIGLNALFGAFLFGAVLPKGGGLATSLAERLESMVTTFLVPLFFAYSGLRTEVALLDAPQHWAVAGVLLAVATAGKLGGVALASRSTGLSWRESGALGVLMNTRGLMGLVVLNIGLDAGVLTPTLFTMLVLVALVTTFATAPSLAWVYPDGAWVRDRLHEPAPVVPDAPPPFTVLACVSDSRSGPGMAAVASALMGDRTAPARVIGLHLQAPTERPSLELRPGGPADRAEPLEAFVERARELSMEVRALSFVSPKPAVDICRTAETKQASLVLLGWHKPLLFEGQLGGVVGEVMGTSSSTVAVLADRGLSDVRRVLVTVSDGDGDRDALALAARMGGCPGVEVTVLHVGVETANPAEAVLARAASGYDLLIVSLRAASLCPERLMAESAIPVLGVRPRVEVAVCEVDRSPLSLAASSEA